MVLALAQPAAHGAKEAVLTLHRAGHWSECHATAPASSPDLIA